MTDIGPSIRTALIDESGITDKLASYKSSYSVHTRRPVPDDAPYPMIICASDVSLTDQDLLNTEIPIIRRDVAVYGLTDPDYRDVESLGYLVRALFHRKKASLTVSGYSVIDVVASGPIEAPTSDEKKTGRIVTLTVRLQKL